MCQKSEIGKLPTPAISVVIPVYGVEEYVARCAESLFTQTIKEGVELIFVNDATKDGSIQVLEGVMDRHKDYPGTFRILTHEVNKGLPAARNTGIKEAKGEYIVHIDGDDFAEPTMLEELYTTAKRENADFVWCDYFITFTDKKRVIHQPDFKEPLDAVRGMLRGAMKYNVWNKMCRRDLYIENIIEFPEGYPMGEDITMIMVALNASRCAYVNKSLYNYVQNPGQMTSVYDEKKLASLLYNCNRLRDYITTHFAPLGLESENAALCQLMKWPFLLDGKMDSYRRWHAWFPESNKFIWQTKGVNARIKFIEWCASKHLLPIVWLHYILVIRLFYGLVYGK